MSRAPSYLGSMSRIERSASVVLTLKLHANLFQINLGGKRQFLRIARPILRNWGVASGDYNTIWAMLEFASKDPQGFEAMCKEHDARKRALASQTAVRVH